MKTSSLIVAIVGVVILAGIGFCIWLFEQKPSAPERPSSVPTGAAWVGGNKGNWIECRPLTQAARFSCEVFADMSGDRLSTGEYMLIAPNGAPVAVVRPRAFDGEVIETGNGKLVPYGVHTFFGGGRDSWKKDYRPPAVGSP